jgi:Ni2+-binding GTPase involved in maturation of urease and hydrogenase
MRSGAGNIRAERDAQRLRKWCKRVAAVETTDLTPAVLHEALGRMDLKGLDVVFIERGGAAPPLP